MSKKILSIAFAFAAAFLSNSALAQYTVRVPVASVAHSPMTISYNFGNVLVGTSPQRIFTFTNRSSEPTTFSPLEALGNASVVTTTCTGTLAPAQSCTIKAALNVTKTGANAGEVRVVHSAATTPDVFQMSATGVQADSLVVFTDSLIDFGEQQLKTESVAKVAELVNQGSSPVDINAVSLSEGQLHYYISESNCEGTLAPGASCQVSVVFYPQSVGFLQGKLRLELGDGTLISGATLAGTSVQGIVTWSTNQVNFASVPVGSTSAPQKVSVTNTGRGKFTIQSLAPVGDAAFAISSTTCSGELAPGNSCDVFVTAAPPDGTVRTATLQLQVSGGSPTTSRVQLYLVPVSEKAVLDVTPTLLDYSSVPVGTSKKLTLTLSSTGNLPVGVNGYTIQGVNASDFTVLNAANCTGALDPGMQCQLDVQFTPSTTGARQAELQIATDMPDPVPLVSLRATGTAGVLTAQPTTLNFGDVVVGNNSSLTSVLKNTGTASLTINNLSMASAASNGYSTTGCIGATLAPNDTCTLTVTFAPTTTGNKTGSITINHTGVPSTTSIAVAGNALPPPSPLASFGAFTCPAPAQTGVAFSCTATLSNTGVVPVTVGAITRSGTIFGAPTHNCPSSLGVGATCTVTLPATIATAGTYSSTVSATTGAGALSSTANVTVQAPKATLTTQPHGSTNIGVPVTATHTVANTGSFPVGLTLPASVGNAVFSVVSTTCTSSLAIGTTCTITTQCTPAAATTYNSTLSLVTTAGTLSQPITCTGTLPPPSGNALVASPNPLSANVKVGTSVPQYLTIRNTGSVPAQITSLKLGGASPGDFSLGTTTCVTTLAAGGICEVYVNFAPKSLGLHSAELQIAANVTGTPAPVQLNVTGVQGTLTPQPAAGDYGTVQIGTSAPITFTLSNTGIASILVSSFTIVGQDAARFSLTGTSNCPLSGMTIAAGSYCTRTVTFTPTSTALATATLRVTSDATNSVVDIPLSGGGKPAPTPAGDLSAFNCPGAIQVGQMFTCTATLTSVGTANLTYSGVTRSNTLFGAPTSNCPASLAPGASCVISISATFNTSGTQTTNVSVSTNAGLLTQPLSVTIAPPSLQLTLNPHGNVQVAASKDVTHQLTNTGSAPVTFSYANPSISGTGFTYVSGTCSGTLAAGASCSFTTRCTPATTGNLTGTATLYVAGGNASGALTCTGVSASASIAATGALSADVGGWSRSGNWYRLTNTGYGPITIQGFYPIDSNWTLFSDNTNTGHCTLNKVLQPGTSCLIMEVLATGAPGNTFSGTQRIRTTAGDSIWSTTMRTYGVTIQQTGPFGSVQTNTSATGTFQVTNLAPYALSQISVNVAGTGYSLDPASPACTSLAAAGQPGSSCTVKVKVTASTTPTTMSGTLQIVGAYPQIINGVTNPATGSGVQGSLAMSATVVAPNVTLTMGTYPTLLLGDSATTTSTLRNEGVGPVTITSEPTLTAGAHSIVSTTCSINTVLQPGTACSIVTRFAPTSASGLTVTMSVGTNIGTKSGTLTGQIVPQSDVSLSVDDGKTVMLVNSATTYTIRVTNGVNGPADIIVLFSDNVSGGASVASRTTPICAVSMPTTSSCSISGNQMTARLAANTYATITQTLTMGANPGQVVMSASATVSGVQDTNTGNNSASNATDVVYPMADFSVALPGLGTIGTGASGTIDVTVRNNTPAGTTAAVNPQARFDYAAYSLTGGANLGLGAASCVGMSAGASCSGMTMTIPAGGYLTMRIPYTANTSQGSVRLDAAVTLLTSGVTDNVSNNNFATTSSITLKDLPVKKRCMFSSYQEEQFIGAAAGQGYNCSLGYSTRLWYTDWMLWQLMDGWKTAQQYFGCNNQTSTYWTDVDPATNRQVNFTWKNNGQTAAVVYDGANATWTVLPIAQVYSQGQWKDDPWSWYAQNGRPGPYYSVIWKNNSTGRVTRTNNGSSYTSPQTTYWSYTGSSSNGRFVSSGTAKDGSQWRQTWIENSPGPNCGGPGTVRIQDNWPAATEYGSISTTQ